MSIITNRDSAEIIKITFPKAQFEEYLAKVGHSDNKPLFPHFSRLIFNLAYKDFKSGGLSLDDFSTICDHLWNHEGNRDDELSNILLLAGELNYYVRHIKTQDRGNFAEFMTKVCEYGDKLSKELP